jgi:hypothetical protein
MNYSLKKCSVFLCVALGCGSLNVHGFAVSPQVKQSPEVVEAYRLCETFEHMLGETLDFDRAYEATFPRNKTLRRAIAIADGEFSDDGLATVDDDSVINAYKRRMQLFYLMLVLASPDTDEEAALFFPPEIKGLLRREPPKDPRNFPTYVSQLDHDVAQFRTHLDRLSARYASVAERIRKFKSDTMAVKFPPPTNYKVEPTTAYYRSGVLGKDEPYYVIGSYFVAKEQGRMRIIGIRFFTRLF